MSIPSEMPSDIPQETIIQDQYNQSSTFSKKIRKKVFIVLIIVITIIVLSAIAYLLINNDSTKVLLDNVNKTESNNNSNISPSASTITKKESVPVIRMPEINGVEQATYFVVTVVGASDIRIKDASGKVKLIQADPLLYSNQDLEEIMVSYGGTNGTDAWTIYIPSGDYTLTVDKISNFAGFIKVIYEFNSGQEELSAVQYPDLAKNVIQGASIVFTEKTISHLILKDGTYVEPEYIIEGKLLDDELPPEIIADVKKLEGDMVLVTLTGKDESGIKSIRYSLGDKVYIYSQPFEVDTSKVKEIKVLGVDNAGNRGSWDQDIIKLVE